MSRTSLAPLLALAVAFLPGPAQPADPGELRYLGGRIESDTAWSGRVRIAGQLAVRKGVTLTLEPGTTVAFEWSDDDGNGIGDGELKVEGRLVARGTAERPITFTSARPGPRPKDWTYVMIELGRGNVVEHCLFEYAFTGLQVHFAEAAVGRSVFRRNWEALRFSTADVTIVDNDIAGNTYGIRYESRGSKGRIAGNCLVGNDYGFFPVIKSTSLVKVEGNSVESLEYNVKMGEEQREDLDFGGNWWGSADEEKVLESFFDGRRDPLLGKVLHRPFLTAPPERCGTGGAGGGK